MSEIKKFADKLVAARDRATAAKYPEVAKLFLQDTSPNLNPVAAASIQEKKALLRRIFLGSINDEEYRDLVERERAEAKPPPYTPPVSNTGIGSGRPSYTRGPSPAEVARSKANLTDADLDAAISKIDDVEQGFFDRETLTPFSEAERKEFVQRYKSNAFDADGDGRTSFNEVIDALRSEGQGVGPFGMPEEKAPDTPEKKVEGPAVPFGSTLLEGVKLEVDEEPFEEEEEKKEEQPKTPEQIRKEIIAEGRLYGLRTKDFASYGGFKTATDIAAGRRPARGATALTGSVGGLNAPSRQLMSERGRIKKKIREAKRLGLNRVAEELGMKLASLNEPTLKSAADVRAEQERKKRLADAQARQARIAELDEQKRLEKLEEELGE